MKPWSKTDSYQVKLCHRDGEWLGDLTVSITVTGAVTNDKIADYLARICDELTGLEWLPKGKEAA